MDVLTLCRKVAASFVRRLPSAKHLYDELVQEGCIAALAREPHYRPGKAAIGTYLYPYIYKAMQVHCAALAGPVNRSPSEAGHHGTTGALNDQGDELETDSTPFDALERREADVLFADKVREASGKFQNADAACEILHAAFSGDTFADVGARHGVSRQRVNQIVQKSGLTQVFS